MKHYFGEISKKLIDSFSLDTTNNRYYLTYLSKYDMKKK